MAYANLSSLQVLEELKKNPDNAELVQEVSRRAQHPDTQFYVEHGLLDIFDVSWRKKSWENCIGRQGCRPTAILEPKSKADLIAVVKSAKGKKGQTVRAVGSGHSFSNICPTDGILLDPHLMNRIITLDPNSLKNPKSAGHLFSVESGITIRDLNDALDARAIALENMGAYDGQTLAGAISTGTHGTGVKLGPIASSVRSLTLVSSSGEVFQIEPTDGITDPSKFNIPGVTLKQDDAWFNTTLVAMGCTGLIYSYTIAVVDKFYLCEHRSLHTWEDLKSGLKDGATSEVLRNHRGYEIDINPYPVDGKHNCIQVLHDDTTAIAPSGWRGLRNWVSGVMASCKILEWMLVHWLNLVPGKLPSILTSSLETLISPDLDHGYTDQSFKVMDIGAVDNIKAFALELSLPCDQNLVSTVDTLLDIINQARIDNVGYMTGPANLRFVAESGAYLAPQAGRTTCMVELDMLYGTWNGDNLFSLVKEKLCTPGSNIRLHWGLNPEDSVTATDVADMYPDWPKWLAVYRELNKDGMWNNKFTETLGISM